MDRRGFLGSILAAGVAPFVCTTSGVLMPIRARKIWTFGDSTIEYEFEEGLWTPSLYQVNNWPEYHIGRYIRVGNMVTIETGAMTIQQFREINRMTDLVTIDGIRYTITNRQLVSYPCEESPEQRKARGAAEAPTLEYTVATIERVRDG